MRFFIIFMMISLIGLVAAVPEITSPRPGDSLQGSVTILGTANGTGFSSYEVSFSYEENPTNTWFLIFNSSQPVENGVLAVWDTSEMSAGGYNLRLRIYQADGAYVDQIIPSLVVNRHLVLATEISANPNLQSTPTSAMVLPDKNLATFTPLPQNPAVLTNEELRSSFGTGLLVALIAIPHILILIYIRRK